MIFASLSKESLTFNVAGFGASGPIGSTRLTPASKRERKDPSEPRFATRSYRSDLCFPRYGFLSKQCPPISKTWRKICRTVRTPCFSSFFLFTSVYETRSHSQSSRAPKQALRLRVSSFTYFEEASKHWQCGTVIFGDFRRERCFLDRVPERFRRTS